MTSFLQGLIDEAAAINLDKVVQKDPQEVVEGEVVLCVLNDELKRWYILYLSVCDEMSRLKKHIEKVGVTTDSAANLIETSDKLYKKADAVCAIFWGSTRDFLEKQPKSQHGYSRNSEIFIRKDWQIVKTVSKCEKCPVVLVCPIHEAGRECSGIHIIEMCLPRG
jgi:hypothetical protein